MTQSCCHTFIRWASGPANNDTRQTMTLIASIVVFSLLRDVLSTYQKYPGHRPDVVSYRLLTDANETVDCLTRCQRDDTCVNVVVFYDKRACFTYDYAITYWGVDFSPQFTAPSPLRLRRDGNAAFFVKVRDHVPPTCAQKLWPIEIIADATLQTKPIETVRNRTRADCARICLNQTLYPCRSFNFKPSTIAVSKIIHGTCEFFDVNRPLLPNAFVVDAAPYGEYIVNSCFNLSDPTKDTCSFIETFDKYLNRWDRAYVNMSEEQCRWECKNEGLFTCYGYSVIPSSYPGIFSCLLHSDDDVLLPNQLILLNGAKYFDRGKCINLTLSCFHDKMTITYTPASKFVGRIYMAGYSNIPECNAYPNNSTVVTLRIKLSGSQCGLIEAKSIGYHNRTLLSGGLIVQYNPLIQTLGDRLIRVGCLIDENYNRIPESITVGTGVSFTSTLPDQGSVVINNSTVTPIVKLMIVDSFDNKLTYDVEVGQTIKLVIQIEPTDGPYDIWAGHLTASSELNETILLLDDRGCPTNPAVLPAMRRFRSVDKKQLFVEFQAFKFAQSSIVKFTLIVHFCVLDCWMADCYARQRRVTNVIGKVNEIARELPLEYVIYVRNQNISPDRLVVGDGRILLAGFDVNKNEFCVDFALMLAIMLVWLVLQVIIFAGSFAIIRRYKAYYDVNYERQSLSDMPSSITSPSQAFTLGTYDRRVHWADQQSCPHVILQ